MPEMSLSEQQQQKKTEMQVNMSSHDSSLP